MSLRCFCLCLSVLRHVTSLHTALVLNTQQRYTLHCAYHHPRQCQQMLPEMSVHI